MRKAYHQSLFQGRVPSTQPDSDDDNHPDDDNERDSHPDDDNDDDKDK